MSTHPLRAETDTLSSSAPCLRNLATNIALLDWTAASKKGLLTANPAPFNLLANGEIGSAWSPPEQILPTDLVAWKKGGNGFAGTTARGLSLLFDPFVDACLLMNARENGGTLPEKTKVLVLTDYYPLKHVIGEMSALIGQDWAANATENFLNAKALALTERNLFEAVLNKSSIAEVQTLGEAGIRAGFAKYRLLVWNYFPFMRGGSRCKDGEGLPSKSDCSWILYCDDLLLKFLECVCASHVIFASNDHVRSARKNPQCKSKLKDAFDSKAYVYQEFDHPMSWFRDFPTKSHNFHALLTAD